MEGGISRMPGGWLDTAVGNDSGAKELCVTMGGGSAYGGCITSEGCVFSKVRGAQHGRCGKPGGAYRKPVSVMDRWV